MILRPHHSLVLFVLLAACDIGPDETDTQGCASIQPIELDLSKPSNGELGRAVFELEKCSIFNCGLAAPLATGHDNQLLIIAADPAVPLDIAEIRAADPEVLSITEPAEPAPSGRRVDIEALAAGVSLIELVDADGAIIDQIEIEVADPVAVSIDTGTEDEAVAVTIDADTLVFATVRDVTGRSLNAFDELTWSTADAEVALVQGPGLIAQVDGVAIGETTVTVTLGELSDEAIVRVE